jgi:hypothetical protein
MRDQLSLVVGDQQPNYAMIPPAARWSAWVSARHVGLIAEQSLARLTSKQTRRGTHLRQISLKGSGDIAV